MKRDKLLFSMLITIIIILFIWSVKRAIPFLQEQFVEWAAAKVSEALNTEVYIESIRLTRWAGIEVRGLTIMDPLSEGEKFFSSPRIEVRLKPLRMIEGNIEFRMITIDEPEIHIHRESGEWNVKSFGKPRGEAEVKKKRRPFRMKITKLILRDSWTRVSDLTSDPFETEMDFNGSLEIGDGKVLIGMNESSLNTSFVSFGAFLFEGDLTIEGKRLSIDDFRLVKEDSKVEGFGYMEFQKPPICHFDVRADHFNFAHIPPGAGTRKYLQGSTQLEAILDGRLLNPDVVGNVSGCKGNLMGYEFKSLAGTVMYSEGDVEVKDLTSRFCGGTIHGDFNFDFSESPASYSAVATLDSFNLVKLPYEIPSQVNSVIHSELLFEGQGFNKEEFKAGSEVSLSASRVGTIDIDSLHVICALSDEGLVIEAGAVEFRGGSVECNGNFSSESYTLSVDASKVDISQFPQLLQIPDLKGALSFDGQVTGDYSDIDCIGIFQLDSLGLDDDVAVNTIQGSCQIDNLPSEPAGHMRIRAEDISIAGVDLASVEAGVLLDEGHFDMKNVFVRIDSTEFLEFSLGATAREEGYALSFSDLTVFHGGSASSTPGTLQVHLDQGRWIFDESTISFAEGTITLKGELAPEGTISLEVRADSIDIYQASQFFKIQKRLEGRLGGELIASGTLENPRISISVKAENVLLEDVDVDSLALGASYASGNFFIDNFSLLKGEYLIRGSLNVPIDLAISEREQRLNSDGNLYGEVFINVPLNFVNLLNTDFRAYDGVFTSNFAISGTAGEPEWSGVGRVSGGSGLYIPTNSYLESIQTSFHMQGNALTIDSLRAGSMGGEVLAEGQIDFKEFLPQDLQFAIRLRDFGVHQIKHVTDLTLDGDLVLEGSIHDPSLRGNLFLKDGELSIPFGRGQQNAAGRDIITFPVNLDIVAEGRDNVWFRNKQANIEMGMDLTVRGGPDGIMVSGEMRPQRGFYLFYGRKFKIEEGSVRFVGSKRINPILDVNASRIIRGRVGKGPDAESSENTLNLHVGGFYNEVEFDIEVLDETGTRLPVPREEAFTLLLLDMTKEEYDSKVGYYQQRVGNQVASMMTQQAASLIQEASPLDVITIDTELFSGETGGESAQISVGKYLARKFYVSYSQDIIEPNVNNFSVEYGLRRRMFIVGQTNSKGDQFNINFKYRFKF